MKYFLICLFPFLAFAEKTGMFLGLGGNYNSVKLDQQLSGTEFSSIFLGDSLVALGGSGGKADPYHTTQSTLAPFAQIGYLYRFSTSCWFLGCKAAYQYMGLIFTENDLHSFQIGQYLATDDVTAWAGRLLISSSQTHVNHELSLLPFFGYLLGNTSVYLSAGPVVFETSNHLYGITSFVQRNAAPSDLVAAPSNFSFSRWMWGGAVQLGLLYSFASTWFLDFNYTYAATGNSSAENTSLFSNSVIANTVYAQEGVTFIKIKQKISAQSFTITIDKIF